MYIQFSISYYLKYLKKLSHISIYLMIIIFFNFTVYDLFVFKCFDVIKRKMRRGHVNKYNFQHQNTYNILSKENF